jgi:hypothetical protein
MRRSSGSGCAGIILVLALLFFGYLFYRANAGLPLAFPVPNIHIEITNVPIETVVSIPNPLSTLVPVTGGNPLGTLIPDLGKIVDTPAPAVTLGQRTKTTGCVIHGSLPDLACTPGAIIPGATKDKICTPGYATSVRDVSQSLKDEVYAAYGITDRSPGQYQVDHLVSLELGGSNDIANLWPQPASPAPGYAEKDRLENYLHDQVCSGNMTLQEAQSREAANWVEVYNGMPK